MLTAELVARIEAAVATIAKDTGRRAVLTITSDGFCVEYIENVELAVSA